RRARAAIGRRDPQPLGAASLGQARHDPRARQPDADPGRQARRLWRPMRRILRRSACPHGPDRRGAPARGLRAMDADACRSGTARRGDGRRRRGPVPVVRLRGLPPDRGHRRERPCGARPHFHRRPAHDRRRHPAPQPGHADGLDRQQPGDQAEQPHAALSESLGRGVAGDRHLSRGAEVKSETGFDAALLERFPTSEPRPENELEELERVWRAPRGWGLLTAVNNNYIGLFYVGAAFLFFILAGVLALVMRVQLALPLQGVLPQETYNQFFTMHGTLMMFLFAVPMMEALGVLLLPQMLAARDLPFPRLSAYAFWANFIGGICFFMSLFFGLAPDGGWFMYPP